MRSPLIIRILVILGATLAALGLLAGHANREVLDGPTFAANVDDIRRDDAVDPIGAGDAFNAGYIAVRLRGGTIADAIRAGARCAAAVAASMSDTAGFPRTLA